jgi:hypothetical protein
MPVGGAVAEHHEFLLGIAFELEDGLVDGQLFDRIVAGLDDLVLVRSAPDALGAQDPQGADARRTVQLLGAVGRRFALAGALVLVPAHLLLELLGHSVDGREHVLGNLLADETAPFAGHVDLGHVAMLLEAEGDMRGTNAAHVAVHPIEAYLDVIAERGRDLEVPTGYRHLHGDAPST